MSRDSKLQAKRLLAAGRHAQAMTIFEDIVQRNPGDLRSWKLLARCAHGLGDHERRGDLLRRRAEQELRLAAAPKRTVADIEAAYALEARTLAEGGETAEGHRRLLKLSHKMRDLHRSARHLHAGIALDLGAGRPVSPSDWTGLLAFHRDLGDAPGEIRTLEAWREATGSATARRQGAIVRDRVGRAEKVRRREASSAIDRFAPPGAAVTIVMPHAYKTAGTSLRNGLRHLFPETCVSLGRSVSARQGLFEDDDFAHGPAPWDIDAIYGHFNFAYAEACLPEVLPRPLRYVTTVREPISRARSIYAYNRDLEPGHNARSNRMRVPYDDDINVVVGRWLEKRGWNGWEGDQCLVVSGAPDFATARDAIDRLYLAAVTPQGIHKLVAGWSEVLGRPPPSYRHNKPSGSARLDIEPKLVARLEGLFEQDRRLFDFVQANEDRLIERSVQALADMVAGASAANEPRAMRA